jgi:hypothetical protein
MEAVVRVEDATNPCFESVRLDLPDEGSCVRSADDLAPKAGVSQPAPRF